MLLTIKPISDRSKVRKDGTGLIFILYCYSSENKILLNTGIAIPPNYWHKKLNRIVEDLPIQYGKAGDLNKELLRQVSIAEDIISFALESKVTDPVAFTRKTYKPDFDLALLEKEKIEEPDKKLLSQCLCGFQRK